MPARKTWLFRLGGLLALLMLCELAAGEVMHLLSYRNSRVHGSGSVSALSLVGVAHEVAKRLGGGDPGREIDPSPFFVADPVFGYVAQPRRYSVKLIRQAPGDSSPQALETIVTINPDGSRWTGQADASRPSLIVLGDSFVFGTGVSDEQTFSYVVQQNRPDYRVRLFALGGYGLTQAYLRFEQLRASLTPNDVIVLGYADFYDVRNVAASSWLRRIDTFEKNTGLGGNWELPRASVSADGAIAIDRVQQRCAANSGYCERPDPPLAEQWRVSAALINAIATRSPGPVFLLHIEGRPDHPVLSQLVSRATLVPALPSDFATFVRDDVAGFDEHPGPYWHYAMSRKILSVLPKADQTPLGPLKLPGQAPR